MAYRLAGESSRLGVARLAALGGNIGGSAAAYIGM